MSWLAIKAKPAVKSGHSILESQPEHCPIDCYAVLGFSYPFTLPVLPLFGFLTLFLKLLFLKGIFEGIILIVKVYTCREGIFGSFEILGLIYLRFDFLIINIEIYRGFIVFNCTFDN